jgi:hypothetical protein
MLKVGDIYKSDKATLNGRKILAIGEPLINSHGEERIPVKLEHPSGSHGEIYLKPEMVYGNTSEESTVGEVMTKVDDAIELVREHYTVTERSKQIADVIVSMSNDELTEFIARRAELLRKLTPPVHVNRSGHNHREDIKCDSTCPEVWN